MLVKPIDKNLSRPGATIAKNRVLPNQSHAGKATPLFLQAKLKIGDADDEYEQEADKVADRVMRMPAYLQRKPEGVQAATGYKPRQVTRQTNSTTATIMRATRRRETRPVKMTRANIEKVVAKSYWETKLEALFSVGYVTPVEARFNSNKEERDAVLSALWQNKPGSKFKKTKTVLSSISARTGVKGSKDLLYRFTFKPKTKAKRASVRVELIIEGGAAKVTPAAVPRASYTPSHLGLSQMGFPKNDKDVYFKANPDEHKQLYNWLENSAPAKFDQVITTAVTKTTKSKTTTRNASFKVKGTKSKLGMSGVIYYLGAILPKSDTPGAGYHDKTHVDYELEKLQSKKKNKLGAITWLTSAPKDEISSVKYTIWQYFKFRKIRKSEIDVIIPIADKKYSVYYTLRFDTKTNDVEVERIGEAGKGKVKPDELDISRVQGFAANAKNAASLKVWLKKRYPAAAVTGKTLTELQTSINKILKTDSNKPDWFKKNYDIHILNATEGDTRMDSVHSWPLARRVGIKSFSASELSRFEISLQSMSLPVLARLKSLRMVRQDSFLKKKGRHYVSEPQTYGFTLSKGSVNTVLMFDGFTDSEQYLFAGGKKGVRSSAVEGITHELGHVVGFQAGIASKFNARFGKSASGKVSWYAATSKGEMFPEAFAFYNTDPQWMEDNHPAMFKWFETLGKTGKPP